MGRGRPRDEVAEGVRRRRGEGAQRRGGEEAHWRRGTKGMRLEVIATSLEDAVEAEAGGADRIELVRDLAAGGMTPPLDLVDAVLSRVRIPVRVMVRHTVAHVVSHDGDRRQI